MYYAGRDLIQVLDADNRPLLQAVYGPSAEAPLFYREGKRTLFPVRNLRALWSPLSVTMVPWSRRFVPRCSV